ncbi:MAG: DUF4870 domain-containing protein [Phycisphaerales bacterium]
MGSRDRHVDLNANASDRTYALFMHLMLPIATFSVLPIVLGPLIMWLIRKDQSAFINDHGKEALNFNLSVLIYIILCAVLIPVCGIGFFLMPIVWILAVVFSIIAAVSANHGEWYRYPACIRIIG